VTNTMQSFAGHYAALDTEDLLEIGRNDLLDEARAALTAELEKRGVPLERATQIQAAGEADRASEPQRTERLASRFKRLIAFAIDFWVVFIVLLLVLLPLRFLSADVHLNVVLAAWLTYMLLRDSIPGQSIGKRVLGLRVVKQENGLSCTWQESLGRNITHLFFYIDALFVLGERRLRLGDRLADTLVVKASAASESR